MKKSERQRRALERFNILPFSEWIHAAKLPANIDPDKALKLHGEYTERKKQERTRLEYSVRHVQP